MASWMVHLRVAEKVFEKLAELAETGRTAMVENGAICNGAKPSTL